MFKVISIDGKVLDQSVANITETVNTTEMSDEEWEWMCAQPLVYVENT